MGGYLTVTMHRSLIRQTLVDKQNGSRCFVGCGEAMFIAVAFKRANTEAWGSCSVLHTVKCRICFYVFCVVGCGRGC